MKGYLEEVIAQKREEFGVSDKISASMIRSRMYQGSLAPTHRGCSPPLLNAELAIVEICIQMGKIRQPLTGEEAIALMNDMIRETEMSETLANFQKAHTSCSESYGHVGRNWWQAFKRQHASQIASKKGEKLVLCHADWMKLSNIKQMYEYI